MHFTYDPVRMTPRDFMPIFVDRKQRCIGCVIKHKKTGAIVGRHRHNEQAWRIADHLNEISGDDRYYATSEWSSK